ncbi:MAG: hypothetical protein LBG19_00965 [Prevotellaceae bacterium]|jgi:hypothetical protein|nr:hypothetical protein [Prevotellaceae bacterium]
MSKASIPPLSPRALDRLDSLQQSEGESAIEAVRSVTRMLLYGFMEVYGDDSKSKRSLITHIQNLIWIEDIFADLIATQDKQIAK